MNDNFQDYSQAIAIQAKAQETMDTVHQKLVNNRRLFEEVEARLLLAEIQKGVNGALSGPNEQIRKVQSVVFLTASPDWKDARQMLDETELLYHLAQNALEMASHQRTYCADYVRYLTAAMHEGKGL